MKPGTSTTRGIPRIVAAMSDRRTSTTSFAVDARRRVGPRRRDPRRRRRPGRATRRSSLALARDDAITRRRRARRTVGRVPRPRASASRRGGPAIVCCTSGTAAANFHPAVDRSAHARVPLLVCTADRPPELRDCGRGADDRPDASVRRRGPLVPRSRSARRRRRRDAAWRAVRVARAFAEALGPPAGPVHLNLPFREPLVPTGAPLVDAPGRDARRTVDAHGACGARSRRRRRSRASRRSCAPHPRGVLVAGWGANVERRPRHAVRDGRRLAGARRSAVERARRPVRDLDVRSAAARASVRGCAPARARRSASARRSRARSPTRGSTGVPHSARRPRRRVARSDARARSVRVAADAELLLDALARVPRAPARRRRRGWSEWLRRRATRARRDRRGARCRRRRVRRHDRARRCSVALPDGGARSSWRRACPCARSSGAWRRATASACTRTAARTASTGSSRRWSASPRAAGPVDRAVRRPVLPARHQRLARRRRRRRRSRSSSSTTTAAGSSRTSPSTNCPSSSGCSRRPHGVDLVAVARAHGAAVGDDRRARAFDVVVAKVDPDASRAKHARMWDAATRAFRVTPGPRISSMGVRTTRDWCVRLVAERTRGISARLRRARSSMLSCTAVVLFLTESLTPARARLVAPGRARRRGCCSSSSVGPAARCRRAGVIIAIAITIFAAVSTPSNQSSDVYSYAMYGRIVTEYHENPFSNYPMHFEGDPMRRARGHDVAAHARHLRSGLHRDHGRARADRSASRRSSCGSRISSSRPPRSARFFGCCGEERAAPRARVRRDCIHSSR